MELYDLILAFLLIFCALALWRHNNISAIARASAWKYCHQQGVQFLDQNVVLKRIAIKPSPHSLFALQRKYLFEFSSVGDHRYQGWISLIGDRVDNIELEPYKTG